jgi:hypothetical protein
MKPGKALLLGGLTVAVLEAIETSTYWWIREKVTPWRIFRYIASGLLGKAAFDGGPEGLWLGIALHVFNALVIVAVYLIASRRFPTLVRHPVVWGLAYGAGVHLVMAYVVIPLSEARRSGTFNPIHFVHSILSQALTVGLPTALFARAAQWPERKSLPAEPATG